MNIEQFEKDLPKNITQPERTRMWYEAFQQEQHIATEGTYGLTPDVIPEDRLNLKMDLIAEEFFELIDAVYGKKSGVTMKDAWRKAKLFDDKTRDIIEAADATGDLRVVLDGFDLETGIPTETVAHEVLLSNMSKLDENGNPVISDGVTPCIHSGEIKPLDKVGKGPFWFEPDLQSIFDGKTPDRTPVLEKNQSDI